MYKTESFNGNNPRSRYCSNFPILIKLYISYISMYPLNYYS